MTTVQKGHVHTELSLKSDGRWQGKEKGSLKAETCEQSLTMEREAERRAERNQCGPE
jgi:hypothetical protein